MPDAVVVNVQRAIATIGANGKNSGGQLRLVSIGRRRVAYAAVAFAACFALLLIVRPEILSVDQQPDPVPSQAEVDQALMEVKQTLAFVSDMGHERNTIVNGHVVEPVQKAMSFIFQSENTTEIQ
ncbi:MAG: hypothetical protein HKN43_01225 [Rhodothermales bacterium]|nr:hypothetical protein [Rhodothermales bacterium]